MADDDNLFVKFFKHPVLMGKKSELAGHPVYEDVDFVSIVIPGDANNVIEREATQSDKERFYKQWEKYSRNQEQTVDGWRLDAWPALTPARVAELQAMNFQTVEQLADAPDNLITKVMGGLELKERAKAAVALAKDSSAAEAYALENKRLSDEVEDLKKQVAELASQKRGKAA